MTAKEKHIQAGMIAFHAYSAEFTGATSDGTQLDSGTPGGKDYFWIANSVKVLMGGTWVNYNWVGAPSNNDNIVNMYLCPNNPANNQLNFPGGIQGNNLGTNNNGAEWNMASNEPSRPSPEELENLLARLPVYSNVSGIWKFDLTKSKVTHNGAAYAVTSLASARNAMVQFGIVNLGSHGFAAIGMYRTPEKTRLTAPMALPKADSYCFEIDMDAQTGQTNFWVNDQGWDMGVLKGFKGGAHVSAFGAGALHPGDHLLSGRFTDCAYAVDGQWQKAEFKRELAKNNLALHQESTMLAADSVSFRDLRTAVI